MLIGKLAATSGFSRDAIRYYEKLGLLELDANSRQDNNYRDYPYQTVERLNCIAQLKDLGFTLTEIKDLFRLVASKTAPCTDLPEQLDQKLDLLRKKIAVLEDYQKKLTAVRHACSSQCCATDGLPSCFTPQAR